MFSWQEIIIGSAATGLVFARLLPGYAGKVASGLLPFLGVLAMLLYAEYFVPYKGGGASMWPVALVFAGSVAAGVGLLTFAIFEAHED